MTPLGGEEGKRDPAARPPGARVGEAILAAALLVHVLVVASLLGQALAHRRGERPERPRVLRLFNDGMHRLGPGADFFALYHAAVALEQDGAIYGWGDDGTTPPYYRYRYLPSFAQSAGRLARAFEPWTAYLIWMLLLEAALVGCLFLTRSLFRDLAPALLPWLYSLWLLFTPFWLELQMGQFTFAAGALLFWSARLLLSSRRGLALAPWIASVGLKIFPAVLLPLWWRRRRLGPAAALLALLALANLPGFLHLPGAWRAFVGANLSAPRFGPDAGNFGLAHLLHLIGVGGLSIPDAHWQHLHRALILATLGLATYLVARRRDPPALPSLALLILAHQLSYQHVWEHHYSLVLPMGLLLLRHEREQGRSGGLVLGLLLLLALPSPFLLWDLPGAADPAARWPLAVQLLMPASKALPTLGLFAVAARALQHGPALEGAAPQPAG